MPPTDWPRGLRTVTVERTFLFFEGWCSQMHKRIGVLAIGLLAASSFATDLVTNGNFESGDSPWTQSSSGNRTIIGDWSATVVSSQGDLGPPTRTAWLGG